MRSAALIAAVFALAAAPAAACTLIIEPLSDGSWESPEAWYRRTNREAQQQAWKDADYVFLAQVRSLRFAGENRIDAGLRTIGSLKGGGGVLRRDTYSPDFGSTCGPTPYPQVGEYGIFYARRTPWWQRWLPWAQAEATYVVPMRDVFDPRIPIEMRAAAARLRKTRP